MTTFYMDQVNGNDANGGTSWADAWKTITGGATAARIAPGDVIRIAKSPDPTSLGQTALWTNLSRAVVLQSGAVTANILVCDGTTGWTSDGGANVMLANDTSNYKLGVNNGKANNRASQIQVGAGFTTGFAAHADLGASGIDLSAYRQCSFWFRPSVDTQADGNVLLKLCSDQAGATPVLTCSLPRCYANQWVPLTFDLGSGNLGTIKSVALYIGADFGAANLNFDNILACKAPGNDALTLQSLISKNSAAQGGMEPWYAIQSINGTNIYIDNHTNCAGNAGRGYTGITETATIYKRETIKTAMAATASADVQAVQDSGSLGSSIEFQGGYNTSSGIQDGETIFDGLNGLGYGLNLNNKNYLMINHLNNYRYQFGMWAIGAFINVTAMNGHNSISALESNGFYNSVMNLFAINNGGGGFRRNSGAYTANISGTIRGYGAMGYYGAFGGFNNGRNIKLAVTARNNATCGLGNPEGYDIIIDPYISADNEGGINASGLFKWVIRNAQISEAGLFGAGGNNFTDYRGSQCFFEKYGGVATDHRIYTDGGNILSETAVRHTASGLAWKLSPTSAIRAAGYPLDLKVAEIAVNANVLVTVSLWMRKTHATGIAGVLVCRGGQIAGVDNDVTQAMSDTADAYEQVQIQFTPTEAGVVEIEAWAYGGTTYSVYVDDLSVSQA
jgi:hypothetical protein